MKATQPPIRRTSYTILALASLLVGLQVRVLADIVAGPPWPVQLFASPVSLFVTVFILTVFTPFLHTPPHPLTQSAKLLLNLALTGYTFLLIAQAIGTTLGTAS